MENDLISRSALLDELQEELDFDTPMYDEEQNKFINTGLRIAVKDVKRQPTVDAVEVVRCRECRHYDIYGYKICTLHSSLPSKYGRGANLYMDKDDFCSYGERRAEDGK